VLRVTGSVCLDYMHNIKKLESDPDLAIQIQVYLMNTMHAVELNTS